MVTKRPLTVHCYTYNCEEQRMTQAECGVSFNEALLNKYQIVVHIISQMLGHNIPSFDRLPIDHISDHSLSIGMIV